MKKLNIKIDMDKACKKCGQPGAMENGHCMKCITDLMENPPFGDKGIDRVHTPDQFVGQACRDEFA